MAEMSFCILLCFCSAFGIPLSWKRLQFGVQLRWIGWDLDFAKVCVCSPPDKLSKLHELLKAGLRGKYIERQNLSKICGSLQWLFKIFPSARPWLRSLYLDLHSPRATNFSLRQCDWKCFIDCLDDSLYVIKVPTGSAISIGSRVLAVRHRKVSTQGGASWR